MDPQLKQRLTGAVILVLIAVLFVPELLRGPRQGGATAGTDPSSVPGATGAEGAPLRSYEIDLSGEPRPSAEPPPASDAEAPPADAAPEGTAAPGDAARAPTPQPKPAAPRTAPRAADASSAAQDGAAPSEAVPANPARAAAPAPAAAAPAATSPQRGFAVQVGSFASRETADRLAGDLRSRRFETFVSPVRNGGRQLYRVRVGPVADRVAAQGLATRLKAAGQKGSVVSLP